MESNYTQQPEDSKSSSEETDRSEQGNDETGTGRSYECVFCKRGFTTAQALGGHMNIHRKDRAKNRPSSMPLASNNNSAKVDHESYSSYRSYSYPPIQSVLPHYSTAPHEVHVNYQAVLPSSSWGSCRPQHYSSYPRDDSYVENHLNPLEDWARDRLTLQIGDSSSHVDRDKEKNMEDEDELDLELRLGHDP